MVETRVVCSRINNIRKAHLGNSAKPLKIFMLHQIKDELTRYRNKTIDGVVNGFEFGKGFQTLTLN